MPGTEPCNSCDGEQSVLSVLKETQDNHNKSDADRAYTKQMRDESELERLKAYAEHLTAESYAHEDTGVYVKEYYVKSDLTIDYNTTNKYSAKHWESLTHVNGQTTGVLEVSSISDLDGVDTTAHTTVIVTGARAGLYTYNPQMVNEESHYIYKGWVLRTDDTHPSLDARHLLEFRQASTIAVVGDSISDGYKLGIERDVGYTGHLRKSISKYVGGDNYGFEQIMPPSGAEKLHATESIGTWSFNTNANTNSPNGLSLTSSTVGDKIIFTVPNLDMNVSIGYARTTAFSLGVKINGIAQNDIVVNATSEYYTFSSFYTMRIGINNSTRYKDNIIELELKSGSVELFGNRYARTMQQPMFDNFSRSGRALRYMDVYEISRIMYSSNSVILALGENDNHLAEGSAGANEALSNLNYFVSKAIAYNKPFMIVDFLIDDPYDHWLKRAFREAVEKVPNARLIDLGSILKINERDTFDVNDVSNSNLFLDGDVTHLNAMGHKWVAKQILDYMHIPMDSDWDWVPKFTDNIIFSAELYTGSPINFDSSGGYEGLSQYTQLARNNIDAKYVKGIDLVSGVCTVDDEGWYRVDAEITFIDGVGIGDQGYMGIDRVDDAGVHTGNYYAIPINPAIDAQNEKHSYAINALIFVANNDKVRLNISYCTGAKIFRATFSMHHVKTVNK